MVISRTRLSVLLAAGSVALGVAGCGGTDDATPTALLPVSAPVALEVTLAPDGQLRTDLEAAATKLLGSKDPEAALRRLAGPLLAESDLTFERDIEPWLGDRAALAVTSLASDPQGFAAIATTDEKAALAAARKGHQVRERSFRDRAYGVDEDGGATAVLDGSLVAGTEAGVKAAISVAAGETDRLVEAGRYTRVRDDVDAEDSLAFAYVDVARVLREAAGAASKANPRAGLALGALETAGLETLGMVLAADGRALRVRGALRSKDGLPKGDGDGAAALRSAPADSLLAIGIGDVGGTIDAALERFGGLLGVGLEAALDQVRRDSGLDVRQDLLAWMGDATLFVRSGGPDDLGGALVIRSKNPDVSRAALPKLATVLGKAGLELKPTEIAGADVAYALQDGPPVILAAGGDRVAIAFGRASVRDALTPGSATLATQPRFRAAASLLGDGIEPGLFVDPQAIGKLIAQVMSSPDGAGTQLPPLLGRLGAVVAGGSTDGDLTRFEGLVALP